LLPPPLSRSWKNIDLRPVVRDDRDLIGAVSRRVRPSDGPRSCPKPIFRRSLTT
jgi:hypothetical protein